MRVLTAKSFRPPAVAVRIRSALRPNAVTKSVWVTA